MNGLDGKQREPTSNLILSIVEAGDSLSLVVGNKTAATSSPPPSFKMATQTSTQTSKVVPTSKYNRPSPPSKIPLHGLDLLATPIHIRNHRFYHCSQSGKNSDAADVVEKLKASLAEALELYPPVTGTVHDNGQGELHIAMDAANIQAIPFLFDAKDTPYVGDSEELSPRTETLLAPGSPILAVKVTQVNVIVLMRCRDSHCRRSALMYYPMKSFLVEL